MVISEKTKARWILLGMTTLVLTACATNEPQKPVVATPVVLAPVDITPKPPESRAAQISDETDLSNGGLTSVVKRFAEGLAKYNEGNFAESIKIFKEPMFERAWPELRLRAHKYLAFSYCVSGNPPQCKKTFIDILKSNPEFDLTSAESGHPLWGPVFTEAKTEAGKTSK